MPDAPIPDYAKHIIVPVANPATAPYLLELAVALAHPTEGKVIALMVATGATEQQAKSIDRLKPVVDKIREQWGNVELEVVQAGSVARGILDTVRERNADLLILGVQHPVHGSVNIGTIAESVASVAPCDVLIFRASQKMDMKKVVFWANGSESARVAARVALMLSRHFNIQAEALFVQSSDRSYWQGLARVEQCLVGLPNAENVKRSVVTAQNLVAGLLSRINEDELFVVGFSRRSELEKWLFGDFSQEILNRAIGPVILTSRASGEDLLPARRWRQRLAAITPTLTRLEQDEIVRQAREQSLPSLDYIALILISAMLATLGLLLNSTAVIIGAMLVAPLMQPITAFSTGMVTGRLPLMERAFITLVMGVGLALGISILTGWIVPTQAPTAEMLSRGSPTLLDAMVAFASGLIGAYATARKDIPAALAGVAIAAALMPPVCTVGLGIAAGDGHLAGGAFLLFLTNIAYIAFAGWAVFFWLGMRPRSEKVDPKATQTIILSPSQNRRLISLGMVVLFGLPILLVLRNLSQNATDNASIENALDDAFQNAHVVSFDIEEEDPLHILAFVRAERRPTFSEVQAAQDRLADELNQVVELEVVYLQVIEPERASGEDTEQTPTPSPTPELIPTPTTP